MVDAVVLIVEPDKQLGFKALRRQRKTKPRLLIRILAFLQKCVDQESPYPIFESLDDIFLNLLEADLIYLAHYCCLK